MKEITLYIRPEDFSKVVNILRKHNVGGITFFEINGSGRRKREPVPERVRMYMTGKMVTPEFVKGTKVEVIVPDSSADQIVEYILDNLSPDTEAHGMIFVKDVSGAYEIGTKQIVTESKSNNNYFKFNNKNIDPIPIAMKTNNKKLDKQSDKFDIQNTQQYLFKKFGVSNMNGLQEKIRAGAFKSKSFDDPDVQKYLTLDFKKEDYITDKDFKNFKKDVIDTRKGKKL